MYNVIIYYKTRSRLAYIYYVCGNAKEQAQMYIASMIHYFQLQLAIYIWIPIASWLQWKAAYYSNVHTLSDLHTVLLQLIRHGLYIHRWDQWHCAGWSIYMINCNQHIVHACIDYAAILNAVCDRRDWSAL